MHWFLLLSATAGSLAGMADDILCRRLGVVVVSIAVAIAADAALYTVEVWDRFSLICI